MKKLINFVASMNWKSWIALTILALAFAAASFMLTSCGLTGRVQGTRKVEKSVIHEQQYDVGKDGSSIYTTRVSSSFCRTKG